MSEEKIDLFLSYNHGDKEWVEKFASSIESEQYDQRTLRVFLDDWDIIPGRNMIQEMERGLTMSRFVCPIISKNSINAEWPNMEWSIAISSDPSGRKGRVIPIWLGDCEIPPSLKIRDVLYCNNEISFKKSYSKLIAVLKNERLPRGINYNNTIQDVFHSEQFPIQYEDEIEEQLVSNLFPVISIPKVIWYGPTNYTNEQVYNLLKTKIIGVFPTFIIKEKKIFCFWDLTDKECPFREILDADSIGSDLVIIWLKNKHKCLWILEMLNKALKHHCQKLNLRFDSGHKRFSFLPKDNQNLVIKWNTGKRKATRTVVKRHTRRNLDDVFWSHQTLKAKFTIIDNDLFLQLIPGWTFTIDGINPLPPKQIGPLSTKWTTNEHNPSVLYHIRFWSSYLSKQSKSIALSLGKDECEIDITPALIELNKGLEDDLDPIEKVFEIADYEIQSTDKIRETMVEEELEESDLEYKHMEE